MQNAAKIIVALDYPTAREALAVTRALAGTGVRFKIGMELFYAEGHALVEKIRKAGPVFLDLKLHDIPETMARTAAVLTGLGVWMFNVHAAAGPDALRLVHDRVTEQAAKSGTPCPLLTAVTVLTSLKDLSHLGLKETAADSADRLARLAHQEGLDGVVCSPQEAARIKSATAPGFLCVTPGIRGPGDAAGDQLRTASAQWALDNGSDYLVIGRPITRDKKPAAALHKILDSLEN